MSITWIRWCGFLKSVVKNFINHAKILGIVFIFILIPSSDSFAQVKAYRNMTDHKLFNPEPNDIYLLNLTKLAKNDNTLYKIYLEKLNKIDDLDITELNIQKIEKYKNLYVGMKLVNYDSINALYFVEVSNMAFSTFEQAKLNLSSPLVYSEQDVFAYAVENVGDFRENRIITNVIRKTQSKPIPNPYKYAFKPIINDVYIVDLVKYEADNREYSEEYSKSNIYQKLWSIDNIYPPEFYKKAENKDKKVYVGMKLISYSVRNDVYGFAITTIGFSSLNEAKIKLPLFDFNRWDVWIDGSGVRRMMKEGIIVDKVRESKYHIKDVDKMDEVDN